MKYKLNLLTIVPLVTVTVGVLAPVKAVSAAIGSELAHDSELNKHSVIVETAAATGDYKAAAEGGHGATAGDYKAAAEGGHGAAEGGYKAAAEGDYKAAAGDYKAAAEGDYKAAAEGGHGAAEGGHGAAEGGHGAAAGGHGAAAGDYKAAAAGGLGAAEGGHGAAEGGHGAAEGGHGAETVVSPRVQQIEFFTFLGAIGLAIIVPELLYRPKKIAQNFLELENSVQEFPQDVFSKSEDTQEYKSEPNTSPSPVKEQTASISQENSIQEFPQDVFSNFEQTQEYNSEQNLPSQVQLVEFGQLTPEEVEEQTASISQETTEAKEQIISASEDTPDLKIIPHHIQPYTIPNRGQSQFNIEGEVEVDNWSQPGRKAA